MWTLTSTLYEPFGGTVYYGSDSDPFNGNECTSEFLAEVWRHYLGVDGANYRV